MSSHRDQPRPCSSRCGRQKKGGCDTRHDPVDTHVAVEPAVLIGRLAQPGRGINDDDAYERTQGDTVSGFHGMRPPAHAVRVYPIEMGHKALPTPYPDRS